LASDVGESLQQTFPCGVPIAEES